MKQVIVTNNSQEVLELLSTTNSAEKEILEDGGIVLMPYLTESPLEAIIIRETPQQIRLQIGENGTVWERILGDGKRAKSWYLDKEQLIPLIQYEEAIFKIAELLMHWDNHSASEILRVLAVLAEMYSLQCVLENLILDGSALAEMLYENPDRIKWCYMEHFVSMDDVECAEEAFFEGEEGVWDEYEEVEDED